MSYAQAQTALDALDPAADRLAYATDTVYAATGAKVTFLSLRAVQADGTPFLTKAQVDAIAAVVQANDPIGYQLLFSTGIDPNHPDAQTLLAALPAATGGVVNAADCDRIRDLARSNPRPRHEAEWGLATFDQSVLDRLADWVKWEALVAIVDALNADVDATVAFAAACPDAAVTYRTTAPADLPAVRAALVGLVQDYAAGITAGTDVSDMPADAGAAWAKAGGA